MTERGSNTPAAIKRLVPAVTITAQNQLCVWCCNEFEPGDRIASRMLYHDWDLDVWVLHAECLEPMGEWISRQQEMRHTVGGD